MNELNSMVKAYNLSTKSYTYHKFKSSLTEMLLNKGYYAEIIKHAPESTHAACCLRRMGNIELLQRQFPRSLDLAIAYAKQKKYKEMLKIWSNETNILIHSLIWTNRIDDFTIYLDSQSNRHNALKSLISKSSYNRQAFINNLYSLNTSNPAVRAPLFLKNHTLSSNQGPAQEREDLIKTLSSSSNDFTTLLLRQFINWDQEKDKVLFYKNIDEMHIIFNNLFNNDHTRIMEFIKGDLSNNEIHSTNNSSFRTYKHDNLISIATGISHELNDNPKSAIGAYKNIVVSNDRRIVQFCAWRINTLESTTHD